RTPAWEQARRTMWLDGLENRTLLSTALPQTTLASAVTVVNFDSTTIESYSGATQDVAGSAISQIGGNQLYQYGNNWKKIAQNYNVTADTVLEFDFKSTTQGEIHGIGFDTDDVLSRENFFQLYGTQNNWGIPSIAQYDASAGNVKHYTIRVGDYFTGQFNYMTFGMDNDIPSPNSNSTFTNIQIYEDTTTTGTGTTGTSGGGEINFNDFAINSYATNQDISQTYTVNTAGTQLTLSQNTWKQIAKNYTVTADTVLEFDFTSTTQGDIHGIGFDTDNVLSRDTFFQLYGTQDNWGIPSVTQYDALAGSVKHYTIRVGDYFTGQFQYLVFANDHDVTNPNSNGSFANLKLYESSTSGADTGTGTDTGGSTAPSLPTVPDAAVVGVDAINFATANIQSYDAAQDVNGSATVLNNGQVLALAGNTWKQIALPTRVDANTFLELDFYSDSLGEVHGIGFDTDSYLSSDKFFELFGTQTFGIQNFDTYSLGNGWMHYKIKVADFFVGNVDYLVLAMDHDVPTPTGTSYFANVQVYQASSPSGPTSSTGSPGIPIAAPAAPTDHNVIEFTNLNVTSYGGAWQDVASVQMVLDGGRTYYLAGNSWKKFDFNYNITASTMLEFDYRSAAEGEVQGIGFDTDDVISNDQFFQVSGSQAWSQYIIDDYNYAEGADGWVHYSIPVGTYFTGLMSYLTIGMDNDISVPISENYFANVAIYNTASDVAVGTPPTADSALQTIDFSTQAITAYDPNQQGGGVAVVEFAGSTLHLTGNTWQKISLPHNINPYTILEFDYLTGIEGEVHGIGFDVDNTFSSTDTRFFQVDGSQTYSIQDYATYTNGAGWTHYQIPVGDFIEGFSQYLVFANDHDVPGASADVYYANVSLYDQFTPDFVPTYSSIYGYGLVDAAAAVADALGVDSLPAQNYYGGQNQYDLNMINVPEVWAQGVTGAGVVVAIIDTGVSITHSDLNDNIWINTGEIAGDGIDNDGNGYIDDVNGYNFVNDNANVNDTNGHGTLVAGVVAAENNAAGAIGVAYDAQIMAVRVLDGSGGGDFFSVLDGIYYAVNNGADVINLSLTFNSGHPFLETALKYAQDRGVVVVMASGNDAASEPLYPAQYANKYGIAVGAVTASGHLTNYTHLAGSVTKDFVVVPGIDIFTTSLGGGYATVSASSFATPLVTGVAALLKAANPSLTAVQIERYIALNANPYAVFL
ncbi:MAG: S8 family serine peptidase, partial [Phycisphaeraceae bacterium]|nr:S8 family serine peptidase [Phycisphaeraceae bacterium]